LGISEKGIVGVDGETAVIIWDKSQKREHFIRSALLDSKSNNVGFLVPTPTTPELAVADARIFDLAKNYLPITRSLSKALPASNSDGIEPRIVAEQEVGNYHAVILAADDTAGLGNWLKRNGYSWTDTSAQWLQPYVAAKWMITAFKVRRSESGVLGTRAIRMSFTADRPFFPYREPAQTGRISPPNRVLRIAILSDERMAGKLGDGRDWRAHLDLAVSSTPNSYLHVNKDDWLIYAGLSQKPGIHLPSRLTYFSDYSDPRPGNSDLYFSSSPDQSDYSP
jgi:hypothetical protein